MDRYGARMTTHIRKPLPRKGGNSFYRDKNDYTRYALTLCGEPVTDKDVDWRTANTKKFRAAGWPVCAGCIHVWCAMTRQEARTR